MCQDQIARTKEQLNDNFTIRYDSLAKLVERMRQQLRQIEDQVQLAVEDVDYLKKKEMIKEQLEVDMDPQDIPNLSKNYKQLHCNSLMKRSVEPKTSNDDLLQWAMPQEDPREHSPDL